MTFDYAGANPKALSVVATTFTGTASVAGFLGWKETR
jgi:hypothetical protein